MTTGQPDNPSGDLKVLHDALDEAAANCGYAILGMTSTTDGHVEVLLTATQTP